MSMRFEYPYPQLYEPCQKRRRVTGVSPANVNPCDQYPSMLVRLLSEPEPEPEPPPVPSTPPPEPVFDMLPVVVSVSAVRDIVASSDVSAVTPSTESRERAEPRDPLLRVARDDPLSLLPLREPVLLREPVPLREAVVPLRDAVLRFFAAVLPLRDPVVLRFFAAVVLLEPLPLFFAAVDPLEPLLRFFAALEPLELVLRFFAALEPLKLVLRFLAAVPVRDVLLCFLAAVPPLLLVLRFFAAVPPLDDFRADAVRLLALLLALLRTSPELPPLLRALSSAIATACFCAFFFDDGWLFPIDPDFS